MTRAYAFLNFGGAATVDPQGPMLTLCVEAKETERPMTGRTANGYGNRIPTECMVKWGSRWRRVYAACYGNAASLYIGKPGAWLATVDVHNTHSA